MGGLLRSYGSGFLVYALLSALNRKMADVLDM
jgi:hypothetical protein